ncbi:MAG: glycoside hydrolase family 15 protein [Burkholderiaceae bacterium]
MNTTAAPENGLDLAVIGNSRIGALIDTNASVVWMCVPRFDGDPVFCSLLDGDSQDGRFDIELEQRTVIRQRYLKNTAILHTEMEDARGARIEVIDFAPRFYQHGRIFAPVSLVRIVRKLAGRPRVRVRFRPRAGYGEETPPMTFGTHHIRAAIPAYPLRLTTDAPITHVIEHNPMLIDDSYTFVLGPDETLQSSPSEAGRVMLEETQRYWRRWVRNLAVPFDWQEAVIRAAITLKLNTFDDTGAVIAAMTTSVPEAPSTQRNWDYRYCWLRDAYFVINALNRLGATGSMERYLRYIESIIFDADPATLQPVYGLSGESRLTERFAEHLVGYGGIGPVRVGNQAWEQIQHDVYGSAILGVSHAFFDHRLDTLGDRALLQRLEPLGEQAYAKFMKPDAGIWEFRGRREVHTFSAVMCWAACDRLARIAERVDPARVLYWRERADLIHEQTCANAWSAKLDGFAATFGGHFADASLLVLGEIGFLRSDDPRLRATVAAIERQLRRGHFLLRYDQPDDFGMPDTAFVVCTFWWIQALALLGERERAVQEFERLLAARNRFGLLSEDIDVQSGRLWGNFPQTYSMVGIIMCAMRLSRRWDDAF